MAANQPELFEADDRDDTSKEKQHVDEKPRKVPEAFEIDFSGTNVKSTTNLQAAFERFRKQRQDDIKEHQRMLRQQDDAKKDPARMEELRHKFVEQSKKYFGVPYARKYWAKDTPEYNSPLFLDCCGLVRQVMRDLHEDFGFRIGPWNQAYMFDTLPIVLQESEMRSGDLVFMSGNYVNPKSKKQRHNMLHVEIWLGEGPKTIGARWNNGKVQVFDTYQFSPKSFTGEQYFFRSLDTWLTGVCKSHCDQHPWGLITYSPGKKSIFFTQQHGLCQQDQSAGDDDDDDDDVTDDVTGDVAGQTTPTQTSNDQSSAAREQSLLRLTDTNGAGDTSRSQQIPDIPDSGDSGTFTAQRVHGIPDVQSLSATDSVTPCTASSANSSCLGSVVTTTTSSCEVSDDTPSVAPTDASSVAHGDTNSQQNCS